MKQYLWMSSAAVVIGAFSSIADLGQEFLEVEQLNSATEHSSALALRYCKILRGF